MRQLTTFVLSGLLASFVLSGNVEACHKKRCTCARVVVCATPAPVLYAQPVAQVKPLPCTRPVPCARPIPCTKPVACAPKPRNCLGGLLARLCHKKQVVTVACATPVSYGSPLPSGQFIASPQTSAQN
jgi:hypothetical protein